MERRLDDMADDVRELRKDFRTFAEKITDKYVREDRLDSVAAAWQAALTATELRIDEQIKSLSRSVDRIDAWLTWAQRIALGAVLVAVLGLVITNGGTAR